jgi:hypothetical protein
VLVLIHGGPVALSNETLAMPAIVDAHYPGEMGGDAVVSFLFADTPQAASGRLTTTVYPADFVNQRNMTDYVLAPHSGPDGSPIPGITHMYYQGPVDFAFGFGLSYTKVRER